MLFDTELNDRRRQFLSELENGLQKKSQRRTESEMNTETESWRRLFVFHIALIA